MKEAYIANEKYRNMFGLEKSGYGCERVDLYLAQLEIAFKKIREENRTLRHEATASTGQAPGANPLVQQQQEQYILQLQAQLRGEQEQNQQLIAQRTQSQSEQHSAAPPTQALLSQVEALRREADGLRQELRQRAQSAPVLSLPSTPGSEDPQSLIGRILVESRGQAEEHVRAARQEAENILKQAQGRVEQLRAEEERITAALQSLSYALTNVLRDTKLSTDAPVQFTAV